MGPALHEFTHRMFIPIPDMAIMFVCVAIRHAIEEYESGIQMLSSFETNPLDSQSRLSAVDSVQTKLIRDNLE